MALLPPGPYIFDVVALHEKKISRAGHHFFIFRVRLVGTTFETNWIVTEPAYWIWREFTDDFHYLAPAVVGRRLLFDVRYEPYMPEIRLGLFEHRPHTPDQPGTRVVNHLVGPLAEVVDYV